MIIYLDQNKWIELSRMVYGKDRSARAARISRIFDALSTANGVNLPLSAMHYLETSRISNVGRKIRLGSTMWRYSKGVTIASYRAVIRHELEVALSKHYPQIKIGTLQILGRGHAHAFWVTPRHVLPAIFEEEVERSMLVGNEKLGIDPPAFRTAQQYRENFRDHLATLYARAQSLPKNLWENFLYGISAVDILDPINEMFTKHKLPKDAIASLGESGLKQVIDDMPTRRVDLHLHKQVLKNPKYLPRTTDLEDWIGLALASCYCDVVVCEKHMADMLKRDRFKTKARIEVDLDKTFPLIGDA